MKASACPPIGAQPWPQLPNQLRGNALEDLAVRPGIDQQGEIRVAVDVYEPGRGYQPGGVQLQTGFRAGEITHRRDAVPRDAEVRPAGRGALPVHQPAAPYHCVEHRRPFLDSESAGAFARPEG